MAIVAKKIHHTQKTRIFIVAITRYTDELQASTIYGHFV